MPGPYTISCRFLGADSISARPFRDHPFPFNEVNFYESPYHP